MTIATPVDDLAILSRNHLLAEAERMARQLRGMELALIEVKREIACGAPSMVALLMLVSAVENLESIE